MQMDKEKWRLEQIKQTQPIDDNDDMHYVRRLHFLRFSAFFILQKCFASNSLQVYSCCGKMLSSEGCTREHRGAWEPYSSGLGIRTKYKWTCCGSRDDAAIGCYAFHPFRDQVCVRVYVCVVLLFCKILSTN